MFWDRDESGCGGSMIGNYATPTKPGVNADYIRDAKNAELTSTPITSNNVSMKLVVSEFGDLAKRTGSEYDVPAVAILAQGWHETHFWDGVASRNNFWGMGTFGGSSGEQPATMADAFITWGEFIYNGNFAFPVGKDVNAKTFISAIKGAWVKGPNATGYDLNSVYPGINDTIDSMTKLLNNTTNESESSSDCAVAGGNIRLIGKPTDDAKDFAQAILNAANESIDNIIISPNAKADLEAIADTGKTSENSIEINPALLALIHATIGQYKIYIGNFDKGHGDYPKGSHFKKGGAVDVTGVCRVSDKECWRTRGGGTVFHDGEKPMLIEFVQYLKGIIDKNPKYGINLRVGQVGEGNSCTVTAVAGVKGFEDSCDHLHIDLHENNSNSESFYGE
jgi:hypothetical protein